MCVGKSDFFGRVEEGLLTFSHARFIFYSVYSYTYQATIQSDIIFNNSDDNSSFQSFRFEKKSNPRLTGCTILLCFP